MSMTISHEDHTILAQSGLLLPHRLGEEILRCYPMSFLEPCLVWVQGRNGSDWHTSSEGTRGNRRQRLLLLFANLKVRKNSLPAFSALLVAEKANAALLPY